MEQPVLTDKNVFPTEELVCSILGKSATSWHAFFQHIQTNLPDLSPEWRYYNDGKRWLMKVTRKAKTVCWVTVNKSAFTTTCYFGDKAENAILRSSLSDELKDQFVNGKRYGKIQAITVTLASKKDIENAKSLIALKLAMK